MSNAAASKVLGLRNQWKMESKHKTKKREKINDGARTENSNISREMKISRISKIKREREKECVRERKTEMKIFVGRKWQIFFFFSFFFDSGLICG